MWIFVDKYGIKWINMVKNSYKTITDISTNFLLGNYEVKLSKGFRLTLPSPYRDILGNKIILTKGIENNLYIFDIARWEKLLKPVTNRSFLNANVRKFLRYLMSQAFVVNVDKLGRFVVPPALRDVEGIDLGQDTTLILAGLYNWVELWSKDAWNKSLKQASKQVGNLADLLDKLEWP